MLLDQAVRATGADAGVVLLLDDGGVLEISSTVGFDADWTQQLSEPATASARKALANQEAVAEDRPEMWPIPGMAKWQHVPLVAPGGPVGVLTLGSKSARKLRSSHMEFLRVLCSEAATAIENVQLRRQLDRLANTDHLTGLSNRREMERLLMIESDRAKRYQRPLAVLMIDIDNLKAVNDCYGHAVGDGVLCTLGSVLAMSIRSSDAAGRVGGDEFLVVLPETDELGAQMLAARVTETFQGEVRAMQTWKELSTPVGLSVGIAATERGGAQASQLLSAADQALYEAKRSGKNRSSVAPPERPVVFVSAGPPVIY
jgi:diguanylate cyclase (GGDEF)-like protein